MTPEEHAVIDAALAWYDASDKEMPAHELAMAVMRMRLAAPATPSQPAEKCRHGNWTYLCFHCHNVQRAERVDQGEGQP